MYFNGIGSDSSFGRLCSSGSLPASRTHGRTQGRTPFHPETDFFVESRSSGPSSSRNTFSVSTITDGNARIGCRSTFSPLRRHDCTLSRLRDEEYDRLVTQSIATPEPSSKTIPTLDRTLVARVTLAHPLLPPITAGLGRDR